MSYSPTAILALTQRETWERLGDRFSGRGAEFQTGDLWSFAGVVCAGVLFFLLLRWLHGLQESRRTSNHPKHLFRDLCSSHRVGYADRHRLQSLAAAHDLESPGVLFVRPDYFLAESLPEELEEEAEQFANLAKKLFSGLKEPAIEAGEAPAEPPTTADLRQAAPEANLAPVVILPENVATATPSPP